MNFIKAFITIIIVLICYFIVKYFDLNTDAFFFAFIITTALFDKE